MLYVSALLTSYLWSPLAGVCVWAWVSVLPICVCVCVYAFLPPDVLCESSTSSPSTVCAGSGEGKRALRQLHCRLCAPRRPVAGERGAVRAAGGVFVRVSAYWICVLMYVFICVCLCVVSCVYVCSMCECKTEAPLMCLRDGGGAVSFGTAALHFSAIQGHSGG